MLGAGPDLVEREVAPAGELRRDEPDQPLHPAAADRQAEAETARVQGHQHIGPARLRGDVGDKEELVIAAAREADAERLPDRAVPAIGPDQVGRAASVVPTLMLELRVHPVRVL